MSPDHLPCWWATVPVRRPGRALRGATRRRRRAGSGARRITEGELNPDLGTNDLWSLVDQLDNDAETYTTLRVIAELRDQLWQVSEDERPSIERQIVSEARSLIA